MNKVPAPPRRGLERVGHDQLGGVDVGEVAHERHGQDGDGHGKVRQQVPHLAGQVAGVAEVLQGITYGKGSGEQNDRLWRRK